MDKLPTPQQPKVPAKVENFAGMKGTQVAELLGSYKGMISQALPKHLSAERIISMATTMITQNPALAECTASSMIGAILQASVLGFRPAPALGECYFVPYYNGKIGKKEVQFQIGYRGYLKLGHQSGQMKSIYAEVVREGDAFEYELGLNPKLRHIPTGDESKQITHAYAVAHTLSGGSVFVVLTRSQIERLRLRSPMQKGSPAGAWATDYDAMARAKALKQLSKYLPMSDEIFNAFASDESIIKEAAITQDHSGVDPAGLEYAEYEDVNNGKKEDPKTEGATDNTLAL